MSLPNPQRTDSSGNFAGTEIIKDLFRRSPVPTLVVDGRSRRISAANRAFAELTGYYGRELTGMMVHDLDQDSSSEVDEYLLLAVACRDNRPRRRTLTRVDGTKVEVEIQAVPVGGERARFLALFARDVSDERAAEEDLSRLQSQLWAAQKHEAIGRLAAGLAHDFNNLLATVMLTTESLRQRCPAGDLLIESDLEVIEDAGLKARDLTKELLAFSGRQVLRSQPMSMNEVVLDMEELLRRTLPADIDFAVRTAEDACAINADRSQMQQVLLNLVVNARDAMPGGGFLIVEVTEVELTEELARDYASVRPGPHVMLSVTDTGVGMDEETQARIFEPFFSTHEMGEGHGLGLATVYGIVKQSGGSIWVTSEPGVGSTFRAYLPRIPASTLGTGLEDSDSQPVPRGSEHVLLVEDEDNVREMTARTLRALGYEVTEAESPKRAIELHEEVWPMRGPHPIDMVLTDVVMPGMSGVELARRLREKREDLPVLFMSGYLDAASDEASRSKPIEPRISKPFTKEEIAHEIRDVLDLVSEESPFRP